MGDSRIGTMVEHLPLRRIAAAFVRYANLTFGGGSATMAVLHRELVARRGWSGPSFSRNEEVWRKVWFVDSFIVVVIRLIKQNT